MAMSVVYTTVAGRIVHENRGGVERFYGQDPLGSTAALYDTSGNKTDEYSYWPYGEIRTHTGSSTTPFTFVGTLGYYMDQVGQLYVRARFLMASLCRWLTVDPLWPGERAYGYVGFRPATLSDPKGTWVPVLVGAGAAGAGTGGVVVGGLTISTGGLILIVVAIGACGYVIYRAVAGAPPTTGVPPTTGTGGPSGPDFWVCVETCTAARVLSGMPPWMWAVARVGCINFCMGILPQGLDEPGIPPPPGGWGGPLPPVGFGGLPGGVGGIRYE